ncbi:MAG: hypothetical protein WAM97_00095 [Acidimicrobiales bacterium]
MAKMHAVYYRDEAGAEPVNDFIEDCRLVFRRRWTCRSTGSTC